MNTADDIALEQLALDVHLFVGERRFDQLLDRLDEFWNKHPRLSKKRGKLLKTLITTGYRIVALHKMDDIERSDAVMRRAIDKYPELPDLKKTRLEHLLIAIDQGKHVEQAVLADAQVMAST